MFPEHPVMRIFEPRPWLGQGPITRVTAQTYGVRGWGHNPRSLGDLTSWWALPCNKAIVVAGIAAAAASALATLAVRQNEKKKGRR